MIQIAHNGDKPYSFDLKTHMVSVVELAQLIGGWTALFILQKQIKDPDTNITSYIFSYGRILNVQH